MQDTLCMYNKLLLPSTLLAKGDFGRQPKARAKHPLRGRHISHIRDLDLTLVNFEFQMVGYFLTDLDFFRCVVVRLA